MDDDVLQLNVSFIDLINRLTQEGNVSISWHLEITT
jgi:hypothetical protein